MYNFTILEFWPTRLLENSLTKENVSPGYESEYPWDGNRTIRPFPLPWEGFLYLGLRSEGLSNLASLSNFPTLSTLASLG